MRLMLLLLLCGTSLLSQPRRIISTAPSITEMLFALGFGSRVAGVTEYCRYPAEALALPKIGSYLRPNLETILALKPDLILLLHTPIHSRERFDALKLPVIEIRNDSIDQIFEALRMIAKAAGHPERAEKLNASIRASLDEVRRRAETRKPVSMMFVVGRNPGSLDNLIVAGKRSYLSEVIELAGGRNAFGDAPVAYPKISHEDLLARNPDVILDMGDMANTSGVTEARKRGVVMLYNRYPNLRAVKNHRVYSVASDIYVVPGPRVTILARELLRLLHGL